MNKMYILSVVTLIFVTNSCTNKPATNLEPCNFGECPSFPTAISQHEKQCHDNPGLRECENITLRFADLQPAAPKFSKSTGATLTLTFSRPLFWVEETINNYVDSTGDKVPTVKVKQQMTNLHGAIELSIPVPQITPSQEQVNKASGTIDHFVVTLQPADLARLNPGEPAVVEIELVDWHSLVHSLGSIAVSVEP